MKYIFLTLFLLHAALAAPIQEDEVIVEDVVPMALPQIEDGRVELPVDDEKEIEDGDDEKETAEAAFMRMINLGMSHGGFPAFGYGQMMNPYANMMQFNPYGGYDQGMSSYGMYNPMDIMMGGMGGGYNPMDMMMGGMGGGYNPMDMMMGGGYNPMDMMMGGMGGYNPMMNNPMMGGGYNPMDMMMGGGYNPMDMMMGGGYNPMDMMMGGMGGYNPMMNNPMMGMGGPFGYMNQKPAENHDEDYYEFKNSDFPIDYTLECSDHCGCEQLCKFNYGKLCTCRCPPRCTVPGVKV